MTKDKLTRSFYHEEAERGIIGSLMLDNRTLPTVMELSDNDFADPFARNAFKAIRSLMMRKEDVNLLTVSEQMDKDGTSSSDTVGALADCSQSVISTAMTSQYVQVVKDRSMRRMLRGICEQSLTAINDPISDTAVVVDQARQALRDIVQTKHGWVGTGDMLLDTYLYLERVAKGEIKPIASNVGSLDKLIGGFFGGEMTILGARPAVGKSAFALNAAISAAQAGKNVCFCSIEMSELQFGQRLMSKGSLVNGMRMRKGELSTEDWCKLAETMTLYADLPISYLFTVNTIEDLSAEVQKRADEGKLDMLIVDYLQLMRTKQRFEAERLKVAHISAALKQMSKDYDIPVIALAQLRRPEGLGNYAPGMRDLKESGNIEQDADNIILTVIRPDAFRGRWPIYGGRQAIRAHRTIRVCTALSRRRWIRRNRARARGEFQLTNCEWAILR